MGSSPIEGPVWDVGVLNGGRWCDAYPLISDLVTKAHRPILLVLGVVVLVALLLTYKDNNG